MVLVFQVVVGSSNLTTVLIDDKAETTKSYATIKLGIAARAKSRWQISNLSCKQV